MPRKERPRNFAPLDVDFLGQDTIEELGHEFGPAGPLVFLAILLEAKKTAHAGIATERQGTVSLRFRAVARRTFVADVELVRKIVDACIRLGLLVGIDQDRTDGEHFTVRLAKWKKWEPRDSGGAARQRRHEERQAEDEPNI